MNYNLFRWSPNLFRWWLFNLINSLESYGFTKLFKKSRMFIKVYIFRISSNCKTLGHGEFWYFEKKNSKILDFMWKKIYFFAIFPGFYGIFLKFRRVHHLAISSCLHWYISLIKKEVTIGYLIARYRLGIPLMRRSVKLH